MHGLGVQVYVSESKRQRAESRIAGARTAQDGYWRPSRRSMGHRGRTPIPLARLAYLMVLCEPAL